jgi:hypothetical protein
MENDNLYTNLVLLLKIFKSRPNHLAKYLIDNMAFQDLFIEKLIKSNKLNDIDDTKGYFEKPFDSSTPYFSNFEDMNNYYNDMMINDVEIDNGDVEEEMNIKLKNLIEEEKYMEAAKIRDYMKRNNIKINI